jgi:hypothetical protein
VNHEIRTPAGQLLETIAWEGPAWSLDREEYRRELRERAIARAYELGALAYERRNANWLESDHASFACSEVSRVEVEVVTPVGTFRLNAIRAEGQESLPARVFGRLNAPFETSSGWTFQPSHFGYADGTWSEFLGSYPRDVHVAPLQAVP